MKIEIDISGDLWIDKELYINVPIKLQHLNFLQSWDRDRKKSSGNIVKLVNDSVKHRINKIKAARPTD